MSQRSPESTSLTVGTQAPTREFGPMTRQMFVRYSGASGDLNPMHYDDTFATKAGYPSVFSQGMHQAALLATFATDWLGPANIRRFKVQFRDQVWPDDILTCSGTVVDVVTDGPEPLVRTELACVNQSGAIVMKGEADFVVGADSVVESP